jgi:hypothetical protein
VVAEEAPDEEEADYKEDCCSDCYACQFLRHGEEGRGNRRVNSPATLIPIIVVVLLCLFSVATTPFAPVPPPLSTVPPFVPVLVPVLPPPEPGSLTPELEGALSGAAVKDVCSVVFRVVDGCICASELSVESREGCDTMLKVDAWVADGGGTVVEAWGGGAFVEVAAGGLAPTPRDRRGDEVGPDPTPRRGAEVPPRGSTPTDRRGAVVGPDPTPKSVPVGSMPIDRRGAEVGPTPAPIRGPEVGATPRERRGSDVGPSSTPNKAPPSADDDPELPPRTGERRPPAALPTPPRRLPSVDEAEDCISMSQVLEYFRIFTYCCCRCSSCC